MKRRFEPRQYLAATSSSAAVACVLTVQLQLESKKTFVQCGVRLYQPDNPDYRPVIRQV
jgi:hypothetical protein